MLYFDHHEPRSTPSFDSFSDHEYATKQSLRSSSGRRVELIKSLRERQRFLQKCELIDILNGTMALSYFSTNHSGSLLNNPNKKQISKVPNKLSVKMKYQNLKLQNLQ